MSRNRFMRPREDGGYDIILKEHRECPWIKDPSHPAYGGYDPERRIGTIGLDEDGVMWQAAHRIGDGSYPIPGAWRTAVEAARAADAYSIEQGRISAAQIAYERARGWSTD
jgi:hypothetical protein